MATIEAPDFNGMSQETFMAGHEIMAIIRNLDPQIKIELFSHLFGALTFELHDGIYTPEDLEPAICAATDSQESLTRYRDSLRHRLSVPEPHDLDY